MSHTIILVRCIERSLRDARVSAIRNRGLKPTANRKRSLRDVIRSAPSVDETTRRDSIPTECGRDCLVETGFPSEKDSPNSAR
jgi:hypothetical protein